MERFARAFAYSALQNSIRSAPRSEGQQRSKAGQLLLIDTVDGFHWSVKLAYSNGPMRQFQWPNNIVFSTANHTSRY